MTEERKTLKKEIKLRSLFMLAFGTIIGIAWLIVLGSWLSQAGSLCAIIGFVVGWAMMLLIGVCYAEVATMYPVSGGEAAYVYEMYGTGMAFAAGWALAFNYVVVTSFEAISVGWVASALFPGIEGPVLYTILGQDIHLGSLALGLGIMAVITAINYRGAKSTTTFQDTMTIILLVASGIFIVAGLAFGDVANLKPLFVKGSSGWALAGILTVLTTTPFWFAGFDTIPQAMGEVEESARLRLIPRVIVAAILLALVFYCLVILTAAMSMPRVDLLAADLPVAAALETALHSVFFGKLVLFAGLCGLLTTWNAIFFAATRLLFSLGRGDMIPRAFGRVHQRFASPAVAVLFVGVVGGLGALLGRNAILPIASASTTMLTVVFLIVSLGVVRLRKTKPDHVRPFRVPGGNVLPYLAAAAAFATFGLSLYEPAKNANGAMPIEWVLLLIWLVLGILFWGAASKMRREISDEERRALLLEQ